METKTDELTQACAGRLSALIDLARAQVKDVTGVEPDQTPLTLPLLDAYLDSHLGQLSDPPRGEYLDAVGCYFGEVARRALNGHWAFAGSPHPRDWRVQLESCFLHFTPVGMAAEALYGCELEGYDGTFGTLDEVRDDLAQILAQTPMVDEREYYSLSGRMEVLTLVAEWLVARASADHEVPPLYRTEDYERRLVDSEGSAADNASSTL